MKRLLTTLKDKWPEYLIESIVIVASILVAISLENWNEERKERLSEKVILRNLKDELVANQQELLRVTTQHEIAMGCMIQILGYYEEGISSISKAELDSLFQNAQIYHTYEPINGYMKSIISSGKLDNLENEKLKSMITAFEGIAEDATQEVTHIHQLFHDRLWVRIDGKFSRLNSNGGVELGGKLVKGYPSDYDWIFQDKIVQDILVNILSWQIGGREDEQKLELHLQNMMEAVNTELHIE